MFTVPLAPTLSRWELAAETIAVKIRWFGLLVGYLYVNTGVPDDQRLPLNAILALGAAYTLLDSLSGLRGRVFLGRLPLVVSSMEALFIGLLCYYQGGLENPFRYYYVLSLICAAIRHSVRVTALTCALHCLSVAVLYLALPLDRRDPFSLGLTLLLLVWVTWAASSLAWILKQFGDHLGRLNVALRENQTDLEARIAERTRELSEAQAQLLHQEKMAAFGLLAAGIAHEVGNPLTSISTILQVLGRRDHDAYTREKLSLVGEQLTRIQGILRELVNFSRPASTERTRLDLADVVAEALGIAKYYKGMKRRRIAVNVPSDLPRIVGVRGQLVSVFLNLILNAIDATSKGGQIEIGASAEVEGLQAWVRDDGPGIAPEHRDRLFQPYFTTKRHGTGLGLFVCRQFVAEHSGEIVCDLRATIGTTFTVRIPGTSLARTT
ncbi:MAG TPA: ATP-binding protein [Gemmataceae bacterium]|jgi:signal transduction histidine kinase|nr:ATP-binding protein [Gemmataceae bacterium]